LTGLTFDHAIYRNQCAVTNKPLNMSKFKYYTEKVVSCGRDMNNIIKVTRHLMGETTDVVLPSGKPANVLAQDFSNFFVDKVEGIHVRSDIARIKSHQQTDSVDPETPKLSILNLKDTYLHINFMKSVSPLLSSFIQQNLLVCVYKTTVSVLLNTTTVLVMLDFSTAFDTFDHSTLLCRLDEYFGIVGKPLQ